MFISRKIYPDLLKHAKTPSVTVLTGMRRTGKTTLIKQLQLDLKNKNSLFIDLQMPDNRLIFSQTNYQNILEYFISQNLNPKRKIIILIDEVQFVPEAPSVIKYLYDHYKIKFIITGSSSYYLKNLFNESLSGRKKIFELFPLDFSEFLAFKKIAYVKNIDLNSYEFSDLDFNRLASAYEEFIHFGGFPQVALVSSKKDKVDILRDILSSYVNIDIRTLADFSDERNLFSLMKLLANRVGSKIDYSKLSRLTGVSRSTIKNYLTFFEKTYLIQTVAVYTRNADREIVKARKLYFCDTGLANILTPIGTGAQFENTVFNQLARVGRVRYYSLKNGREIDFILNEEYAVEVKETPTEIDLNKLKTISNTAGLKKYFLIGKNKSPKFRKYIWGGDLNQQINI